KFGGQVSRIQVFYFWVLSLRRNESGGLYPGCFRSFLLSRMQPEDAVDTVEKKIHQLQIPTLVIAADSDETIPLWHCETYTNEIAAAELVIIPNSTHGLPQT
ncbi:alpha/beta fold hydrolase, partial [Microcoleus sp.]|uniref:alpha/beta fold hydrolase n=1 Tax=Microcoleus sp. TaxID=44472 RepID=UPI00403EBA91